MTQKEAKEALLIAAANDGHLTLLVIQAMGFTLEEALRLFNEWKTDQAEALAQAEQIIREVQR